MFLLPLYATTILLSAALLFAVQPMVAKRVLPLLGGSPAVWTTCMLFFQALLLAGYAYAHLVSRYLKERAQVLVHLAVVCLPLATMPIGMPDGWSAPAAEYPVFWLLGLLAVLIGGPFFALSATTPLLQRWFAATSHRAAHDPYFLYAASNIGSMAALFAYPFLIEPNLGLNQQSTVWSTGYALLAAALALCMLTVWKQGSARTSPGPFQADRLDTESSAAKSPGGEPPTWRRRLQWLALSFIPSSWMLGTTTTLTTDFVPIPLLWILPLALYLLTFILAFADRVRPPHEWMLKLFPPVVLLLALASTFRGSLALMLVHLFGLFVAGMVCHGELVRRRPRAEDLTEFYLWLSYGGMLGGLLNAVVAPLVFSRVLEYPLTIVAGCVAFSLLGDGKRGRADFIIRGVVTPAIVAGLLLNSEAISSPVQYDILLYSMPVGLMFYWLDWRLPLAAAVAVPLLASPYKLMRGVEVLHVDRSFFGVHQVVRDEAGHYKLTHGTIFHGWQNRQGRAECIPRAYYHPSGPLGDVFLTQGPQRARQPVAYVGLGAGAAICYLKPDQHATIYEIDPVVVEVAENPEYFTYLSRCARGTYEIIVGDGRQKLGQADDGAYGMIVLDAFTGDAVPKHLLTREAMQLYLKKLADDGLLVVHISNLYLDLEPVIADLAADAGCVCATGRDPVGDGSSASGKLGSTWMVVARDPRGLKPLTRLPRWKESTHAGMGRVWTDDYSSLIGILRLRWR